MGRLRRFLSSYIPRLNNLLFIESGTREVSERILPILYQQSPYVDIVTCYGSAPAAFDASRGQVFDVSDYQGSAGRKKLYAELWAKHYSAVGFIDDETPIMFKWKFAVAARLPGKLFVVNENCDYFWVDRANFHIVRKFVLYRLGLTGADAARTLSHVLLFPFTLLYLLLYAAWVHARRAARALTSV